MVLKLQKITERSKFNRNNAETVKKNIKKRLVEII